MANDQGRTTSIVADQLLGLTLFLFIPVVLYLFVAHPEPVGASLAVGVTLMLGHRLLARPYMRRVAARRCLWSGGGLAGHDAETVHLGGRGTDLRASVRSVHARDLHRFFTFVQRRRLPLRVGIFLPLLVLLGTLLAASLGRASDGTLATATDVFRLVIGLTVNFAAWGWRTVRRPDENIVVPFPVHNFFLLGVRGLLWIFRIVGVWWIALGLVGLMGLASSFEAREEIRGHETTTRQMALTFDDLPAQGSPRRATEQMARINHALVNLLDERRLPAIGFVNENKLEVDGTVSGKRVALLRLWLDAGLELGNHTYSHPDLHRVPRVDFEKDVLDGERILRPLLAERGTAPRYFRHPFLHTGQDLATRDGVHAFLAEHGYRVAPVTIDNSEWIYSAAYDRVHRALDEALMDRLGASYVDYMESMVAYYEEQSRRLFGREIPQVLLLHANLLNADHLSPLLDRLVARGYDFVTLDAALEDPAYGTADEYVGPGGITWLHRWAITKKVDPATFRGEPATPAWVQEAAEISE